MPQHTPRVEEWEGYGSYERIGRDPGLLDALRWGVYQPMGQIPELSALLAPLSATQEVNGLVSVRSELVEPAMAALESMKLVVPSGATDPIDGKATWVANFPSATDWVHQAVVNGQAVLVQIATVTSGSPSVCLTAQPAVVAQRCQKGGGWAVVTGQNQVLDAAAALVLGQTAPGPGTTVPVVCPSGTSLDPVTGLCVAMQVSPAVAAESKPLASWVIPVVVGGGALLIIGLLVVAQREPVRATIPNRRRRTVGRRRRRGDTRARR